MSKKIQLSVHEPCHENWDNMSPVEKGRFCGSCQKQVVDFSNMNDRQIAEFFKKPSTGSVCGRFMTDQLDRDIEIPKKRIPWFRYFFTIALPAMFVTKAGAQKMGKVAAVPVTQKDTTTRAYENVIGKISPTIRPVCDSDSLMPMTMGEISEIPRQLEFDFKGQVYDENGNPLRGATVTIKNTNNGITTNARGKFSLKVRSGELISISAPGYYTFEEQVTFGSKLNVQLQKIGAVEVIAGMVSIDWRQQRPDPVVDLVEVKTTESISIIDNIESNTNTQFKVFPNPVVTGQYLSVQCGNLEKRNYTLQWLDASGNLLRQETVNTFNKASFRTYVPPVAAGSYYLVLTDKKSGKKFVKKIIVQ